MSPNTAEALPIRMAGQSAGLSEGLRGSPPKSDAFRPAGFLRRAISYLLDLALILLLISFLMWVGSMGLQTETSQNTLIQQQIEIIFYLAAFFIYMGYFSFFHSQGGQTPGKMVLRIRVLGRSGETLSALHASVRSLAHCLSYLFIGFGFLMTLVGQKRKALHDYLCGTQVVLSD